MTLLSAFVLASLVVQVDTTDMPRGSMQTAPMHEMFSTSFAGGWQLMGMAQAFPIFTVGRTDGATSPLDDEGFYLTQPAAMINVESPDRRFTLRLTPNFEGLTQEDGELTVAGWGEGFIDRRHPHTLLHEAMLSVNLWDDAGGGLSVSAGKGFAPYGTDDPMARPSVKYPTNHHLSQILERFTLNAVWLKGPWGVEAGLFGGAEPDGPYDFSNIESFGDSWSARVSRRLGAQAMGRWDLELSASYGRVSEEHGDGDPELTVLYNGAARLDRDVGNGSNLYALLEYSVSDPEEHTGFWSALGEVAWTRGPHRPYARFERSTRPEYPREGATGNAFFRYDHEAEPIGATAWTILSVGYGFTATTGSVSVRPFFEAQLFNAAGERGGVSASSLYGSDRIGVFTVGARLYLGGDPMRMGSYGVLDPMSRMGSHSGGGMEMMH